MCCSKFLNCTRKSLPLQKTIRDLRGIQETSLTIKLARPTGLKLNAIVAFRLHIYECNFRTFESYLSPFHRNVMGSGLAQQKLSLICVQ